MHKWLHWAKQMQAIAQAGLAFSKDVYDLERFEQLRQLSVEIMSEYTDTEMEKVTALFANETGYQTPKLDVRGVVFKERKILLVREKSDGLWALPGGFPDIGFSPSEAVVKEVKEESGLDVEVVRLLALWDKEKHAQVPSPYHYYLIWIQCQIIGGELTGGVETSEADLFGLDELPPLSLTRCTEEQIRRIFTYLDNPTAFAEVD
jgi:ADP-ribose pyrophosphatase YjhB (NUDIX family)